MKVICIDDSPWTQGTAPQPLVNGQEYNVEDLRHGYHLPGITPFYTKEGYRVISITKARFVPLSEIDERELSHAEPIESTYIIKEV